MPVKEIGMNIVAKLTCTPALASAPLGVAQPVAPFTNSDFEKFGTYFSKKEYVPESLPTYADIRIV